MRGSRFALAVFLLNLVIGLSFIFFPQTVLAKERELPPGISKQGRIPGKGSHKGWEQGKHKGWEKNKSEEPKALKHQEEIEEK